MLDKHKIDLLLLAYDNGGVDDFFELVNTPLFAGLSLQSDVDSLGNHHV